MKIIKLLNTSFNHRLMFNAIWFFKTRLRTVICALLLQRICYQLTHVLKKNAKFGEMLIYFFITF